MENQAFALWSKCSIFHNIFKVLKTLLRFFMILFSMLTKNRKCHDLKVAFGVNG